jgi:hypothetical protein
MSKDEYAYVLRDENVYMLLYAHVRTHVRDPGFLPVQKG